MHSSRPRKITGFFFVWFVASGLAVEVSIQRVEEQSHSSGEEPQHYIRISINKSVYRCAILDEWALMANVSNVHFAAFPPPGVSGMIGVRVEPCLDEGGEPLSHLTKELLDAQIKCLQPPEARFEATLPLLDEAATTVEVEFLRIEKSQAVKCRYLFRVVQGQLWTFVCEASPQDYPEIHRMYCVLSGTFSPAPTDR